MTHPTELNNLEFNTIFFPRCADNLFKVAIMFLKFNPFPLSSQEYLFFGDKDSLFFSMWETFRVNSLNAYGDYDESCIFAYAVGKVIESFYTFYKLEKQSVVAHFNEWMLGMGALYLQKQIPEIATIFTTHATSIGRSIAGNNKALYAYMDGYNGDQMAYELNMEAKHSLEKQTALHVDCFTTVSDITAVECKKLLDKEPDVITPNGFELNFVPEGDQYSAKRKQARCQLIRIAEKLIGSEVSENAILVSTSGRYEYSYDEMNRLTGVMHDGQQLRSYSYDAFGNRRRKTEYTQNGKLITTYGYNTKNQLTTENSENGIRNYSYDHRGNLLSVTSGEEVLKAYGFDAANQMSSSMGMTDGIIQKAVYQYNGLGHRMGQSIATGDAAPTRTIRYTLDLTRQ